MFAFAKLLLFLHLVNYIAGESENVQCSVVTLPLSSSVQFNCIGLTTLLRHIQDAPKNTTSISIVSSKISVIPRQSFTKFGSTLETLDLQRCGIETIEPDGFSYLYFLKKLILSENKLTRIMGESFVNLFKLQHLDISFNNIFYIDSMFFKPERFPALEKLYIDYNQLETIDYTLFPLLYSLRNVKFGRNPWKWGYRALLTQQLDNMRVDYRDDWEEWGWMSTALRECEDSGKGNALDNKILDCVIIKLLRMDIGNEHAISRLASGNVTSGNLCVPEATALIDCYIRSTSAGEATRRTFEGITATLKEMGQSSGKVKSFPLVAVN